MEKGIHFLYRMLFRKILYSMLLVVMLFNMVLLNPLLNAIHRSEELLWDQCWITE